jgi:hypothetical protein
MYLEPLNKAFLGDIKVIVLVKHPEQVHNSDTHSAEVTDKEIERVLSAR